MRPTSMLARLGWTALLLGGLTGCGFDSNQTFDDLLASFEGQPNNVLVAQLLTGRKGDVSAHQDTVFDQAITGFGHVSIVFPGQCCPPFVGGGEEGGFFFFKNAS